MIGPDGWDSLGPTWAAWETTEAGWVAGAGWATIVGCSVHDARECEAWARLGNALSSRWAWSDMAWVMALVSWALDGKAWDCFGGTARALVVVPWTSPRVATTAVVPVMETRGGGANPPIVTFSLVDCRSPIS
ncbi:hypothetical protein ACFX2C_015013 [Malus domestica]